MLRVVQVFGVVCSALGGLISSSPCCAMVDGRVLFKQVETASGHSVGKKDKVGSVPLHSLPHPLPIYLLALLFALFSSSPSFPLSQGKSVPVLCLEGLSELLQTVVTRYHGKEPLDGQGPTSTALLSFLTALNPSVDGSSGLGDRIHHFIRQLQVCGCG